MTTEHILAIASDGYDSDGTVLRADIDGDRAGDTLALFIAREIRDVVDKDADDIAQIASAVSALLKASGQLASTALVLLEHRTSTISLQQEFSHENGN